MPLFQKRQPSASIHFPSPLTSWIPSENDYVKSANRAPQFTSLLRSLRGYRQKTTISKAPTERLSLPAFSAHFVKTVRKRLCQKCQQNASVSFPSPLTSYILAENDYLKSANRVPQSTFVLCSSSTYRQRTTMSKGQQSASIYFLSPLTSYI